MAGHRIHLVDAFRVFDANNSKLLTRESFTKMLQFFDVTGTKITCVDVPIVTRFAPDPSLNWPFGFARASDIESLFKMLNLESHEKGDLVSLEQVRTFFGRDV